jgi:alpha-tubulin suppressor-like RCC1 family protein
VTTHNAAYCWGENFDGHLGIGTDAGPELCFGFAACSTRPVRVTGGLPFRLVSAGEDHACAVTTGGVAYCWGLNDVGQLGVGTDGGPEICPSSFGNLPCSRTPARVAGGLAFRAVNGGQHHTCGVTSDNVAYCWGANFSGELGDGTTARRTRPTRVAGGLRFERVNAGYDHTCGFTTASVAYCWGRNQAGQLGIGTDTGPRTCSGFSCSTRPLAVVAPRPRALRTVAWEKGPSEIALSGLRLRGRLVARRWEPGAW